MIIHRGTHTVGDWRFTTQVRSSVPNAAPAFASAMSVLGRVAALLRERRLLTVDHARIRMPNDVSSKALDHDLTSSDPVAEVQRILAGTYAGLTPLDVELSGLGVLLGPTAERQLRDVVVVSALELGGTGNVLVETRCDAWLPFDLRGRPQRELSELNAPRLRAALEEIEQVLGIKGVCSTSKFARCDGYALLNHFDVCDEPIDISEFGYGDDWIASP